MEGLKGTLDPDVVDGRGGRNVNWKGYWIRTLSLEGDRKGRWIGALLMKGLDPGVVGGRVGRGRC